MISDKNEKTDLKNMLMTLEDMKSTFPHPPTYVYPRLIPIPFYPHSHSPLLGSFLAWSLGISISP